MPRIDVSDTPASKNKVLLFMNTLSEIKGGTPPFKDTTALCISAFMVGVVSAIMAGKGSLD